MTPPPCSSASQLLWRGLTSRARASSATAPRLPDADRRPLTAIQYRARHGENPLATLRRRQVSLIARPGALPPLRRAVERPAMAVLPFKLIGLSNGPQSRPPIGFQS